MKDSNANASSESLMCVVCGTSGSTPKHCGRCKGMQYCSRTCQAKDWSHHKRFCCNEEEKEEIRVTNDKNRLLAKKIKKGIRNETLDQVETPFSTVPVGPPPNFALKQQANLYYQRGPSSKEANLGNSMVKSTFEPTTMI